MPVLVADCPRCGSKRISFDLTQAYIYEIRYNWQNWFESFCICRNCIRATIFILSQKDISDSKYLENGGLLKINGGLNNYVKVEWFVSLKDNVKNKPPEHVPNKITTIFKEGATCLSVNCFNAASTMFRLCVDLTTRDMLPNNNQNGLNAKIGEFLSPRLTWLFNNGLLPETLKDLSTCIKNDGNDGAHRGTLEKEDAEDLLDFTYALLERIYTEPEKIRIAKQRRKIRRGKKA